MGLWFRMHTSIVNNSKVQSLPPDLFKAWVNLLALSKETNQDVLPSISEVAFQLRCTERQAKKWIDALCGARFFDRGEDGLLRPHDWLEHQFISDVSTERVRKFREAKKKPPETVPETPNGAAMKRQRNVSGTPSEPEPEPEPETEIETAAAAPAVCRPPPPPNWPLAHAAVRSRFKLSDVMLVQKIAEAARKIDYNLTDEKLAQLIDSAWQPSQQRAGLFLITVPALLANQMADEQAACEAKQQETERSIAETLDLYSRSDTETQVQLKQIWPELSNRWPKKLGA